MHDEAQANHTWIFYPDDNDPLTPSRVKVVELPSHGTESSVNYQLIVDDKVVSTDHLSSLWQMFRYVEAQMREGTLKSKTAPNRRDPEFVSAFLRAMKDDPTLHDRIAIFEAGAKGQLVDEWFELEVAKKFEDDWRAYSRIKELVEKKK
jgi:hypothetical protein